MRSFWASRLAPQFPTRIHPALSSFVDECCATSARLIAYVGTLALLAILGLHLLDQLPALEVSEPPAKADWNVASRSRPAFAVSQFDLAEKTETYEILRHPEGGRKDIFRWAVQGKAPIAELEIYRPGTEFSQSEPVLADLAARMDPEGGFELEAAGLIDSKFGPVMLLRQAGQPGNTSACLGFMKRFGEPNLRISGWSCQGDALPARRAAIGCLLSRLVLLAAGNDAKLAELFARAELRRGTCAAPGTAAPSADWVTSAENPHLRGTF
jgi:hypothetical protein